MQAGDWKPNQIDIVVDALDLSSSERRRMIDLAKKLVSHLNLHGKEIAVIENNADISVIPSCALRIPTQIKVDRRITETGPELHFVDMGDTNDISGLSLNKPKGFDEQT